MWCGGESEREREREGLGRGVGRFDFELIDGMAIF